jgi:bifunctional non-homologous end joining protein LigD
VDLQGLRLSERKRDLHRLCARARILFLRLVQTFPNGELLLDHCEKFGFEGVVSKRLASHYRSGPSRAWVKVKCEAWKAANENRGESL